MTQSLSSFAAASRGEGPSAIETGAVIIGAYATARPPSHNEIEAVMADTTAQLDSVAASISASGSRELMLALFGSGEFAGNIGEYYDPENSLLPSLFKHKRGNPITLSVLAIAVGRRLGIELNAVSMPGHFLLSSDDSPGIWLDPFHSGAALGRDDVERFFRQLHGGAAQLELTHLEPVGARLLLTRMLNNLRIIYGHTGSLHDLAWVGLLSATLPGGADWAIPIAEVLEAEHRYGQAASIFEAAAEFGAPDNGHVYAAAAERLRGLEY